VLTALLIAAGLAGVPPLYDPVAGSTPSLHLRTPELYLILAPLFSLWDGVSMLSMSRLEGFLTGLALLYLAWRISAQFTERSFASPRVAGGVALLARRRFSWRREVAALALSIVALLAFLLAGALWHRPMLSLAGVAPNNLVVDFHSHTNLSHDVADTWMSGFDSEANRRWHTRAGFDVAFITDHNVVSRESRVASHELGSGNSETIACPGIEVSAWRAHVVLLGDTLPVDRSRYNGSLEELLRLLRTSESAYGAVSLASIPEYRRNHWGRLDTLIAAGLDGFEIVNASPKANELTRADRDRVIALARAHDRFVAGVSDSHGWGATSMVWNLVGVPPGSGNTGPCGLVLQRLRDGFPAVQVIERHRLRGDAGWPLWLTPVGVLWETWRSMGWPQTGSWIVWIWLGGFLLRRRRLGANIA
jgi:hypothetical protein